MDEESTQETIFSQTLDKRVLEHAFDSEWLQHISTFSEIEYLEKLVIRIEESMLKRQTKDSFLGIIQGFTCRDTLLGNINDPEYATIVLEQHLNKVAVSARKSDTAKAEYLEIISDIRDWFELFIAPRAQGKERERVIAATTTIENRHIIKPPEEQRQERGMGILNRLRR